MKRTLPLLNSEYLRPSKFLLVSFDDSDNISNESSDCETLKPINDKEAEENLLETNRQISTQSTDLLKISDCWFYVIQFLTVDESFELLFLCKDLTQELLLIFRDTTKYIYETNLHMYGIFDKIRHFETIHTRHPDLFTDLSTWKPSLFFNKSDWEENSHVDFDHYATNQEEIESETFRFGYKPNFYHNKGEETDEFGQIIPGTEPEIIEEDEITEDDATIDLPDEKEIIDKRIPFGIPLCEETIEEQFHLSQDSIYSEEYKVLVQKYLKLTDEQVQNLKLDEDLFIFYRNIKSDQSQIDSYINDVQKSIVSNDDNTSILLETYECKRFAKFEHIYSLDDTFMYHSIRDGIKNLLRSRGIIYFEPIMIENALFLLQKYIRKILKKVVENKYGENANVAIPYTVSEYEYEQSFRAEFEGYGGDLEDELEDELKVSGMDIMNALDESDKLYMFVDTQPSRTEEDAENDVDDEEVSDNELESLLENAESAVKGAEDDEDDEGEESMNPNEENKIEDVDFIDDSELETLDQSKIMEGSIEDELLQVSLRVHSEIYGEERTLSEKLYLKNWYGNGSLFFKHSHLNTSLEEWKENEIDYQSLSETELLELTRNEDLEYFGKNSLQILDEMDESEEQANEELSKEYQLRRILREESYKCIHDFFNKQ